VDSSVEVFRGHVGISHGGLNVRVSQTRDVVFFFGAGVSIADGPPLLATILPMLYADPILNSADISDLKDVKAFLREFFNYQGESENVPNLEYVFGFIDFFLSKGEALSAVYTLALLTQRADG
jgi:hypothetical protein